MITLTEFENKATQKSDLNPFKLIKNKMKNQKRIDKILSVRFRYYEGSMTRKEWIELMHKNRATVRSTLNNRDKPEYFLYPSYYNKSWIITKTEFDYFNSL